MGTAEIIELVIALAPLGKQVIQDVLALLSKKGDLGPTGNEWVAAFRIADKPLDEGLNPDAIQPDAPTLKP